MEDFAIKKKRANRIQIAGTETKTAQKASAEADAKNKKAESSFTKWKVGSDYYATNEEDPLLSSSTGTKGFKKKSNALAGQKRNRLNALALADHDNQEEDIVAQLE